MCRETFDLQRQEAFKGIRHYAVALVSVDFVRNVGKGVRGWTGEDSEIGWHDARDRDVPRDS